MELNLSQRYILALQELQQFLPYKSKPLDLKAVHVLTGVQVTATSGLNEEEGLINLQYPGAHEFQVKGGLYLKLQIAESAAHEIHLTDDSSSPIAVRSNALFNHLCREFKLI